MIWYCQDQASVKHKIVMGHKAAQLHLCVAVDKERKVA